MSLSTQFLKENTLNDISQLLLDSSTFEYNIPTPKTKGQNCIRDDRLRIQTLYFEAGYTRAQIVLQLHVTIDQI